MNKNKIFGIVILFICVFIWGIAFVYQSEASKFIGPFYVNTIRFAMGATMLIPVLIISIWLDKKNNKKIHLKQGIIYGVICGLALAIATNLQQFGIERTSPGKAGFLTAMYIAFVPLISFVLFKRKINILQIIGIIVAIVGVGLLSLTSDFSINLGDILCILCSFMFAIQIICVEKSVSKINPIIISVVSFYTVSLVSSIFAISLEDISIESVKNSLFPLLFLGILSSGVAYTFQTIGEKFISGTPASLIMSLESVIAAIFSWIMLNESLSIKEIIGCVLVFIGVVVVQVFDRNNKAVN